MKIVETMPTPICTRCGHPIDDHLVYNDAPDPELLPRLTEAHFENLETHGFYCPHLDMVAGLDYDEEKP